MNPLRMLPARMPALLTLFALLVLSACDITAPQPPGLESTARGFAFHVDPRTKRVTPVESTSAESLRVQEEPGDTRLLVPDQEVRFKDFSFEFASPDKLVVRLRVENTTDDLDFAQPFSFTLDASSNNLVEASAPPVTDAALGGDGVLSPGETSGRFPFEVTFKEDEPFTFFVDVRATVVERTACTDPVAIPDENLDAAIREALGEQEGELTCEDLASLETFDASGRQISDLTGIENLTNLAELNLRENVISDLTPLANLTNLTRLVLAVNEITDLTPLENLTELTELNLAFNEITDLTGLENLTNLVNLNLFTNQVSDLTPLANLTGLTTLVLSFNEITDLTGLENLTNLLVLRLFTNQVSDLTPLANLTNLAELSFPANEVADLTPLTNLTELTLLNLFGNQASDLTPLANLTRLNTLALFGNQISDLTGLEDLTSLDLLDVGNNAVVDLSPLEDLSALTQLLLDGNRIEDISALVANSGLDAGDAVNLANNPLSAQAFEDVETLRERGVEVTSD